MQPIPALASTSAPSPPPAAMEEGDLFDVVLGPEGVVATRAAAEFARLPPPLPPPPLPIAGNAGDGVETGRMPPWPAAPGSPAPEDGAGAGAAGPAMPARPSVVAGPRPPVATPAVHQGTVSAAAMTETPQAPVAQSARQAEGKVEVAPPPGGPAAGVAHPIPPPVSLPQRPVSAQAAPARAIPAATDAPPPAGAEGAADEPGLLRPLAGSDAPDVTGSMRDKGLPSPDARPDDPGESRRSAPRLPDMAASTLPAPSLPSAPPATVHPPGPTTGTHFAVPLSQLPAAVISALNSGAGIAIDLAPADLGRMRIELPAAPGAVVVRLVVEQPDTLPLVRMAAATLVEDLRQAGIMAQSVTVELLAVERIDPLRAEVPRAEPGGATAPAGPAASGSGERGGAASHDGGAGSWRGSGDDAGRHGGPPVATGDPPPVAMAERLDLRL